MSASERRRPRERWNSNRYFFNAEVLVIIMAEFTRAEARSANKFDSGAIGGFLRASALSTVLMGKLRELRAAELGRKHQYRRGRKPQRKLHGGADSGWFAPLTDRNLATARGRSIEGMEECQCTLAMRFSFGLRGMTCRYIHRSWSTPLCTCLLYTSDAADE